MRPVKSNVSSAKCDNPIGTDCIIVSNVCGASTLTEKLAQLDESVSCCEGDFPVGSGSCYTGSWVTFSSSIPASGSSTTCTWIVDTSITNFGPPQYRWDRNGDLRVRGGIQTNYNPGCSYRNRFYTTGYSSYYLFSYRCILSTV